MGDELAAETRASKVKAAEETQGLQGVGTLSRDVERRERVCATVWHLGALETRDYHNRTRTGIAVTAHRNSRHTARTSRPTALDWSDVTFV
jgi:hypothetical protein